MLIFGVVRVDNPSSTATAAGAKESAEERTLAGGFEESLPEGIWNFPSAYMRSLCAELIMAVACDGGSQIIRKICDVFQETAQSLTTDLLV